ncbi:MAG TPA: hypothetical protein VIT63_07305, partial [Nitrospira sp.]
MKWVGRAIVHVPPGELACDDHRSSKMYTKLERSRSLVGLSMTPSSSLKPTILRIGEQLAQLSAGLSPSIFDGRWWSHSAINLAMKDASFKTR